MNRIHFMLDRFLQAFAIFILLLLTAIVIMAVIFRFSGNSLIWYDEVASILLAWLTYVGSCLAAMRNAHMGFAGIMMKFGPNKRVWIYILGRIVIILFLSTIAYAGFYVLQIFQGEALISLPFISRTFTQSVLPISCLIYILAEILIMPESLKNIKSGFNPDNQEVEETVSRYISNGEKE